MRIHVILLFLFVSCVTSAELQQQQTLDQQINDHLDPSLDSETEHIAKDQDKRTIFGPQPHIYLGKHVGIHPSGFKYLLGYGPVDIKYKSPIKHYKVFKPVPVKLHYHSRPAVHLKPVAPVRQYLPAHVHSGWKPVVRPPKPVVPVQPPFISLLPPKPIHLPPPAVPVAPAPVPVVPIPPAPVVPGPALPVPAPVVPIPAPEPPSHHHFVFQTPVSRPVLVPQVHRVLKPNLGVLPLGATFPAHVLPPPAPVAHPVALPAPHPVFPEPVPVHHHVVPAPAPAPFPVPVPQPLPVHHPAVLPHLHQHPPHPHFHVGGPVAFPAPAPPLPPPPVPLPHGEFPHPGEAHHIPTPFPQPVPKVPDVPPPALVPNYDQRPLFVEFHGIPSLNPLNKSNFPPSSGGSPVPEPAPASPAFPPTGQELPTPSLGPPNVQQYQQQFHEQQQYQQQLQDQQQYQQQLQEQQLYQQQLKEQQQYQQQLQEQQQQQNYHSQGYHYQGNHGYSFSHGDPNQEFEPIGPNIQPGQTDLQLPLHLPEHPLYRPQEQGQNQLNPYQTISYQTHGNLDAFRSPVNHHQNPFQRKGEEDGADEGSREVVNNHQPPFKPSQRLQTPIDRSDEIDDEEEEQN